MIYHQQQKPAWCPTQKTFWAVSSFDQITSRKQLCFPRANELKKIHSVTMSVGFRGHMAYVVAYMRSILGSIPFLVKLYTFFLCCGIFFWLPAPHPLPFPPVYFMLTILSSVRREVFATLLFTSIVYIFLCFPAFPCQETA